MVDIVYRSVKGSPLTSAEGDTNLANIVAAVAAVEAAVGTAGASITNITISGSLMTVHLSNATSYTVAVPVPVTLPPPVRTVEEDTFTPDALSQNEYHRCTHIAGCAVIIEDEVTAVWTPDTEMHFRVAVGAGAISVTGVSGVTINGVTGFLTETAVGVEGAVFTLKYVASDVWDIFGGPFEPEGST